ncbi:MAG: hypothetical protein IVW57_18285, partial [Ktedonobacterales bacterium]|nr:hypothetical protein [Ktedonobacterales bacterium]
PLPPTSSALDGIIRTADCYLEDAPENALADEDPAAMGLAMLAEARLLRVAGVNENRTTPIIIVAQTARQFHDEALEGQAYTTLAHELFAQGEYGSARAVYTQALGAFRAKGLDALAIAPHRGIARIDMWYAGGYSAGV